MTTIKLNLMENAEGFLKEAIGKAVSAESDVDEWKFAILHLVQAIELSLKELLRREHPWLIYESVDTRKHTVSLKTACKRLVDLRSHGIGEDDAEQILRAGEIRNEIVHFEFELNEAKLRLRFAELLVFVQDLWKTYLSKPFIEIVDQQTWTKFVKIKDHGDQLFKAVEKRMVDLEIDRSKVMRCYACGWRAFVGGSGNNKCLLCGHRASTSICCQCNQRAFTVEGATNTYLEEFTCNMCIFREMLRSRSRNVD